MFHKSEFDQYGHQFPHDRQGHVPVRHDHWQEMDFDHGDMDPHEKGISADERTRRIEWLNLQWWPQIQQQVNDECDRLAKEHGETFTTHWNRIVDQPPDTQPHGFGVT